MADRLSRVVATARERYGVEIDLELLRATVAAAEDRAIADVVIGALPPNLVHEKRNKRSYLEAEVADAIDPASVQHDELSTIHWYDVAERAAVDSPEPVGNPAGYQGLDPIEDVALPPKLDWSDADKKAALEQAIRIYGIEPGQWFDLEWPPVAHLWDPGSVYQTEFEPCEAHIEQDGDDTCSDCQSSARDVVEQMAQWKWTTTLYINEIGFDRDGLESSVEVHTEPAFEVAVTEQDPREVLLGPPGQGHRW